MELFVSGKLFIFGSIIIIVVSVHGGGHHIWEVPPIQVEKYFQVSNEFNVMKSLQTHSPTDSLRSNIILCTNDAVYQAQPPHPYRSSVFAI